MGKHLHYAGLFSIPAGQTASNALVGAGIVQSLLGSIISFVVFTPVSLGENTRIQVAPTANPAPSDWATLEITPGFAPLLAANRAEDLTAIAGFRALRFSTDTPAGAQRDFQVVAQVDVDWSI